MLETLSRKLERFVPLSPEDKRMLERATAKVQQVGAREDFLCEGEVSNDLHLVLNGFACRYKILRDGFIRDFTACMAAMNGATK